MQAAPHPVHDVVLGLQEAEPPAPAGQVVDVVRDLVDELVRLVDERRDEECGDPDDPGQDDQVRRTGREATALQAVALEQLDERVHREREEDRDQDPRDHVPRYPDHLEHHADRDHDPEDGEDRSRREVDEPLPHGASISHVEG